MVSLNRAPVRSINLVLTRSLGDAEDGVIRLVAHCLLPLLGFLIANLAEDNPQNLRGMIRAKL